MRVYRAWINQPSTLQPLHHLHGEAGIAIERDGHTTLYFVTGPVFSMVVDPLWLSEGSR